MRISIGWICSGKLDIMFLELYVCRLTLLELGVYCRWFVEVICWYLIIIVIGCIEVIIVDSFYVEVISIYISDRYLIMINFWVDK